MRTTFRERRLSRGWTLRDLAQKVAERGLPTPSDSNLSSIERGKTSPRPPLRLALAELLDLDVTYFDDRPDRVSA